MPENPVFSFSVNAMDNMVSNTSWVAPRRNVGKSKAAKSMVWYPLVE
jgi:hypothetical protein